MGQTVDEFLDMSWLYARVDTLQLFAAADYQLRVVDKRYNVQQGVDEVITTHSVSQGSFFQYEKKWIRE